MSLQVKAALPGLHTPCREQEGMALAGRLSGLGALPETFLELGATAAAAGRQHSSGPASAGPRLLSGNVLPTPFEAAGSAGAGPAASGHPEVARSQSAVAAAMDLSCGTTLVDYLLNERHGQPEMPYSSLGQVMAQGWPQGLPPARSAAASLPWLPPIDPQELEARQAGSHPQGWQEVGGTQAAAAGSSTEGRQQPGSAEAGHSVSVPLFSALLGRLPQPGPRQQRQTGAPQAHSRGVPCQDGAAWPEGAVPCPAVSRDDQSDRGTAGLLPCMPRLQSQQC